MDRVRRPAISGSYKSRDWRSFWLRRPRMHADPARLPRSSLTLGFGIGDEDPAPRVLNAARPILRLGLTIKGLGLLGVSLAPDKRLPDPLIARTWALDERRRAAPLFDGFVAGLSQKAGYFAGSARKCLIYWSGREDLNLRPPEPHSDKYPFPYKALVKNSVYNQ